MKINTLLIFLALATLSFSVNGQHAHIGEKKLYYGVAYYPESWDMENIDDDIEKMKDLNMNVVRMAEFAWAKMEPAEGDYHFEWLHDVIDKLTDAGIDVILGTPTATPPAWLGQKHPEIYRVDEEGISKTHGARRNCSYTSEVFREYSRKIVEKMAESIGNKEGVIGWQTDNEFSVSPDYSEETKKKWHKWLKKRYGHIDTLNKLWNTQLWSQVYNEFAQVPMDRSYVWHHPSLRFNWIRFTNDMIVDYQKIQLDAIRKHSDIPITHDGMPGQVIDYVKLFKDLDYMAVNNYHSFEAYDRIQSNYDRMRGYHKGFHWLFETAPNNSGGGKKGQTWFLHQPEGSMKAAIWMNHALGGQGTMFWLWKQHWAGQEMPHGAIIHSWGGKAANYDDLKSMGEELAQTSDFLMNNPVPKAEVAMFWSHQNLTGFKIEQYANGIDYYKDWTYRFYRPVTDAFIHREVIHQETDLDDYKVLLAPLMPYMSKSLRARLEKWVKDGGTLILGPMSGYRTKEWTSYKDHAMGDLEDWIGINVDSRIPVGTKQRAAEVPLKIQLNNELGGDEELVGLWSEALSYQKGKVIARYNSGMHKGQPAIIESSAGKGKVVVLGTDPGKDVYGKLVAAYAREQGIEPLAKGDSEVIVAPRNESDMMIVNIANDDKTIYLEPGNTYEDQLNNEPVEGEIQLKPYEVKLLIQKD